MDLDFANLDPHAAKVWPAHVWHDCTVHGHVGGRHDEDGGYAGGCQSCDGGLGGCVVCGQWEGEIRDHGRCIGANPRRSLEGMDAALNYYYDVVPVLRPAKAGDDALRVGGFIVVWDGGMWQYPGEISEVIDATNFRVRTPYDGIAGPMMVPLEWEPGVPAIGVYDPMNAVLD